ncbi:hypothetical protein CN899_29040 [Bacillus thuringiensis]|uniref:Protective antigen heptamerisation domain-containing protein n=1 Tax=Bacillus thuringiensis TaxID=1428 RepID=A0A9X7BTT6_BACTU|nr:hypothetical protein CN899_29040 [Bacillus thuringiensis]
MPAEAAYLNANVRYFNSGTAPIYETKPTTNFVTQPSGDAQYTITANANSTALSMGPNETYPEGTKAPITNHIKSGKPNRNCRY